MLEVELFLTYVASVNAHWKTWQHFLIVNGVAYELGARPGPHPHLSFEPRVPRCTTLTDLGQKNIIEMQPTTVSIIIKPLSKGYGKIRDSSQRLDKCFRNGIK